MWHLTPALQDVSNVPIFLGLCVYHVRWQTSQKHLAIRRHFCSKVLGVDVVQPSFVTAARGQAATSAKLSLCLSCHLLYWKSKHVSPTRVCLHCSLEIPTFSSSGSTTVHVWELPAVTTPPAMLPSVSWWRLNAALWALLNSLMLQG